MDICLYFQVHQPFRLNRFTVFDIGKSDERFDEENNRLIVERIAEHCYLPMNKLLLKLIKEKNVKVAFSISGTALDQFNEYATDVILSFRELAATGNVEFLCETYYHSLASLYSLSEFSEQVAMHKAKIKELFGVEPKVFRNTELVYSNKIAEEVKDLGFKGILAEGTNTEEINPNFMYNSECGLPVLLRNYSLTDDIAFRFSDKTWDEWPMGPKRYVEKLNSEKGDFVGLFMDYETFGEHQTKETGIFKFMENLPDEVSKEKGKFLLPSEIIGSIESAGKVDLIVPTSWADTSRDLSAWAGNKMQSSALNAIYMLENDILSSGDSELVIAWRRLQTSDHFYYMCTKFFNDGDVHKYFNPYETPYEAFIAFMNIVNDLIVRVKEKKKCD